MYKRQAKKQSNRRGTAKTASGRKNTRKMCIRDRQGGVRPVLIIQNDVGNRHSPTVICAAITSKMNKAKLPTHIEIDASSYGIEKDSVILLEQLRTIDKKRLKDKVCHLDQTMLDRVNHALEISLELTF